MKEFLINIKGLSLKVHEFRFHIGDSFFEHFGKELVQKGNLQVELDLDKRETFLEASFVIKGSVGLICDRSLETFTHPIALESRVLFKYAAVAEEVSEDIIHITKETDQIDAGKLIYDLVGTAIPMKKLHPKFQNESNDDAGSIVYTSGKPEDQIDPRWEKLKKLL